MAADEKKRGARTAVYIDGYNLYYGRLRGTDFKWLDLVSLFTGILKKRDQNEQLERLTLFTAPALANFASNGAESTKAQKDYHRALQTLYPDVFSCVYGKHSYDKSGSLLPTFISGVPYNRKNRSRVWKLEEKKTDVNLAISMYRDCAKGVCDRLILVSNDSDAEPALNAIREDFPDIMLGVVIPVRPPMHVTSVDRRVSSSLVDNTHWAIDNLTDAQLSEAQLPEMVLTNKKPIRKPAHWYSKTDSLININLDDIKK